MGSTYPGPLKGVETLFGRSPSSAALLASATLPTQRKGAMNLFFMGHRILNGAEWRYLKRRKACWFPTANIASASGRLV